MDFYGAENQDGVRLTWNNLPSSKATILKNVLPPSVIYTPLRDVENLMTLEYEPLKCRCSGIINPFCVIDFKQKGWYCTFCNGKNNFPTHYASHISEENLPAELIQDYTTIEYISQKCEPTPLVFLFLIDTCTYESELQVIKDSIQQSLNLIPSNALVGLITFGKYVFVHELGQQETSKQYAFNGQKQYSSIQIQEQLGITISNDPRGAQNNNEMKKIFLPLQECEFNLNTILDDLTVDPWPVPSDERPQRALYQAYNIAISLLEVLKIPGSRIVSFLSGPCTVGNGAVVDIKLTQTIRTFYDIQKQNENTKNMKTAQKSYQELATRAVKAQLVIDMFGFSLDQFGLFEMKTLCEKTGGYVTVQEEFDSEIFRETYRKYFETDQNNNLKFNSAALLDVFVSKDIKLQGAFGPCVSMKKVGPMVSEVQIGQAGTSLWYMGGIVNYLIQDKCTSISIQLDVINNQHVAGKTYSPAYMQFQTTYKHSNGQTRLRVTTITRRFADETVQDFAQGFDQEAACVSLARLCVEKSEKEEPLDILKWFLFNFRVDRTLIRFAQRFATYKKEETQSFRFGREFSLFPQFIYHLRRSPFIQCFGSSPDEAQFYRSNLMRENTTNSLVMIQPALLKYSFDNAQPVPVGLDIESLQPDIILLLDTYFSVIIWNGEKIHQWKELGYQDQPDFAHFKDLLELPNEDVKIIMEDRFPSPLFINCNQGSGKERLLKCKVNPSTQNTTNTENGNYITDDASLKIFMDHLIRLVVTQ